MNPDSYQNIREEIIKFVSQPSVRAQLREEVNRLCEMVEKRKEVIRPIVKEANKQAETTKGIVRGTPRDGYYFGCEYNTFCKAAEQCGFLHWLPAEPPNPIEWFPGFSVVPLGGDLKFRGMKPDEEFMVNAVILASIHDGEMRKRNPYASQFVCHNEPYAGRVFERDNFLLELWRYFVGCSLEKQTQLERALQNVTAAQGEPESGQKQVQDGTEGEKLSLALTDDETKVLAYLNEQYPTIRYQEDVVASFTPHTRERKTIGVLLKDLMKKGLVSRPTGKRTGYIITPEGKDLYAEYYS